jgi:hypothetical protein
MGEFGDSETSFRQMPGQQTDPAHEHSRPESPDVRLDGEIHDPDMHGMQHNVPAGAVPNKIEEVLRAAPPGNAYRQHFDYAQALRGPMTPASLEATLAHESTTCGQRRECGPCARQ